jgi:hypothetical protein
MKETQTYGKIEINRHHNAQIVVGLTVLVDHFVAQQRFVVLTAIESAI